MPPEFSPASPSAPPPIADYELLRLIGRGSYGDVWLARGVTGVFRAVKIVWRDRFDDVRPYEREFEGITRFAAISLREPSQLALLHAGRQDAAGFFYYVMELADDVTNGREIDPATYVPCTLKDFSSQRGHRLDTAEVVALGTALARALASLHAAGLVHRDIKPSNVILVGGVPKLADVGLVAVASAALTFVGTEGFVPPEGPGAPSADVYSLGKLLYELATGLDRHDWPRLPPDLDTRPDQRALLELNEVLVRACEPDASKRYIDAAALLDELLLLQAGKSVRRLRSAERRLAGALRVAGLLAVIATIAGAGAWIEHRRAAEAEAERDALARRSIYSAGLSRAQRALEINEFGRARKLLTELLPQSGKPDQRGFEWQALWRESQGDLADVLREEGSALQRAHFSPDGIFIAAQSADLVVTLWDAVSHREVRKIPDVFGLAGFSNDGRWLVGVNRKVAIQRWSVLTGEPEGPAVGEGMVNRPIASLGNDCLACFTEGQKGQPHFVHIWDFNRQTDVAKMPVTLAADGTRWDFYRACLSDDGRQCALALIGGRAQDARWKLEIYEVATGRLLYTESTPHRLTALAFSHDASHLAVGFGDTAEIGSLDIGRARWNWKVPNGTAQSDVLVFSADDALLCAGGRDPSLHVIDGHDGRLLNELRGHGGGVTDAVWMPKTGRLLSVSSAGDVRLWEKWSAHLCSELTGLWKPAGSGRRLCLARDGSWLAASDDPALGALVASTRNLSVRGRVPGMWFPVDFEGEDVFGVRGNGRWERWQVDSSPREKNGIALFEPPFVANGVAGVSSDRRVAVVAGTQGELAFWNLAERRCLARTVAHQGAIWCASVSPDGRWALTVGSDQRVILWQTEHGQSMRIWPNNHALCGAFSPDGNQVALGLADGRVEIRSAASDALVRVLQTDSGRIQSVSFSPGNRLACGGTRGTIHVFATDDWREVLTWRVTASADSRGDTTVSSLAFDEKGTVLAAYLNDGRIRLWRTQLGGISPNRPGIPAADNHHPSL